ncbi:MAG: hypothetical protein DME75_06650 [Verrucomicrobia bacterium]|nr:MAG: hypothetical protein DME75_06650 [Verrucomicrobiota bacterium]
MLIVEFAGGSHPEPRNVRQSCRRKRRSDIGSQTAASLFWRGAPSAAPRAGSTKSPRRPLPSPRIDKDLPTFYGFQFQNAVLEPGIVLHFLSHFIFIFSIED